MAKIAFIGTGVMGAAMAGHMMDAGHDLIVYNRTKSKTDDLVARGASYAQSPKLAAEKADFVITIVGYPKDVREVYFGTEGIFQNELSGKVLIDMTTTEPTLAKEIYTEAAKKEASALDAPVSGGDLGAKKASLTIMVGGDETTYHKAYPLFEAMGKTITLQGPAGSGQHTKMANQICIAGTMTGMTELLVYAQKAGLDLEKVLTTVGGGSGATWSLANYAPRILREDYSAGFFVKHFIKDLGIALAEAQKMGLELPATAQAKKLYDQLADKGFENDGTQALIKLWWDQGHLPK
ncbi:NAD(P)-dependent oxidoreductase [Lactococcus taiwanensis]|uniref:NAD(P)-dependent oxidoreductase n=1 Tax=Lactococcus taiwanensis TaxID=1151742 RepID=UPI0028964390|nr:NAD(P)-dependent oxidoreductase [Lactococcus taiwanensis]